MPYLGEMGSAIAPRGFEDVYAQIARLRDVDPSAAYNLYQSIPSTAYNVYGTAPMGWINERGEVTEGQAPTAPPSPFQHNLGGYNVYYDFTTGQLQWPEGVSPSQQQALTQQYPQLSIPSVWNLADPVQAAQKNQDFGVLSPGTLSALLSTGLGVGLSAASMAFAPGVDAAAGSAAGTQGGSEATAQAMQFPESLVTGSELENFAQAGSPLDSTVLLSSQPYLGATPSAIAPAGIPALGAVGAEGVSQVPHLTVDTPPLSDTMYPPIPAGGNLAGVTGTAINQAMAPGSTPWLQYLSALSLAKSGGEMLLGGGRQPQTLSANQPAFTGTAYGPGGGLATNFQSGPMPGTYQPGGFGINQITDFSGQTGTVGPNVNPAALSSLPMAAQVAQQSGANAPTQMNNQLAAAVGGTVANAAARTGGGLSPQFLANLTAQNAGFGNNPDASSQALALIRQQYPQLFQ